MLLSLDISLSTGYAFGGPADDQPAGGVWRLPEGPHNYHRALVAMRQSVLRFLVDPRVTHMAVEAPLLQINRKHGTYPLFLLVSLGAIAREVAAERGVPISTPSAQTWRANVLGNGNLKTAEAKAAAEARCKQLKWSFADDNEAEAKCIWYHTATQLWPKWPPAKMKKRAA